MVSTSRWVSSAGLPPTGGVRLPQIRPRCGSKRVGRGAAGDERIHPGAAALVFARKPVGVEAAQERAVLVVDVVVAHVRIPDGHAGFLGDADAVEPLDQVEHSGHHALQREVGAQRLLVEIVERGALLFGVVGDVPGLEIGGAGAFQRRGGTPAAPGSPRGSGARSWRLQVLQESAGRGRRCGPCGLPARGRRNRGSRAAGPSRGAIPECGRAAGGCRARARWRGRVGFVELAADGGVVQVGHHREVVGRLQGEAPAGLALCARRCARADSSGAGRQAGQVGFGSVITSSKALVESRTFSENLVVRRVSSTSISSSCFLPAGSRSAPWRRKRVHGLVQKAPPLAGQRLRLRPSRRTP